MEEISLEEIKKMLISTWTEKVDFNKPPSENNMYIDIFEGWSDKDETNKNRYWMFSATIPCRGMLMTGKQGFIKLWDKMTPVKYNGKMLSVKDYDYFLNYCIDGRD